MFHVPEQARITDPLLPMASNASYGNNGAFLLDSPVVGWTLYIIASDLALDPDPVPWEHVSVQALRREPPAHRVPSWKEMCYVKGIFWDGDDVVMQLHPKESEYVNCHPAVLHLWRPVGLDIPTPPAGMVGPRE